MNARKIRVPLSAEDIASLNAGELVELSGTVYTARDAAHKRLADMYAAGEPLPLELAGACIYYAGPCPAAPGEVIGPCGPTTSSRMDPYTPLMTDLGSTAMIGKGVRSPAVKAAVQGRAVYFVATGGAGLLISNWIKSAETIAFADLGAEAIMRLEVEDMPVIVAMDSHGGDLFDRTAK